MTQPPEPTGQQLLDEEALAYELAAEAAVTGALEAAVSTFSAGLLALFTTLLATVEGSQLTTQLGRRLSEIAQQRLAAIRHGMRPELQRQADAGFELGVEQGRDWMPEPVTGVAGASDVEVQQAIEVVDQRAAEQLSTAVQLAQLLPMTTQQDVTSVTAQARKAVTGAQATTRWVANRAVNDGTAAVADAAGVGLMWIAERDACLHCLAYSGVTVPPGGLFPENLTFDDRPLNLPAVPYPPRHPNCRCRVRPWSSLPGTTNISDPYPPSALMREARRSVVRGWSAYDSQRARLAAADRLLRAGANLPKSVEARGRKAVERGSFGTR